MSLRVGAQCQQWGVSEAWREACCQGMSEAGRGPCYQEWGMSAEGSQGACCQEWVMTQRGVRVQQGRGRGIRVQQGRGRGLHAQAWNATDPCSAPGTLRYTLNLMPQASARP